MMSSVSVRILAFKASCAAAVLFMACSTATASKFTLIDGEGFESPDYSAGILEGQFASTFEDAGSSPWVQSPLGGTSVATVQSTVVASGDQAVQVDRAANSDDRWGVFITGAPALDKPLICIEWDMYVEEATATPDGSFGPFFGVEAYDDDATTILRVASLGVDAATGDILYTLRDDGVQAGFLVETGFTVDFDEWISFRIVLDYAADQYYGYLGNQLIISAPFEQDGADQFTDADITAIAASFDAASQSAVGTAYFDNYEVFETDDYSKIPEPGALALLLVGLATAAFRKR